jgi:MFS transporter, UMF1 family
MTNQPQLNDPRTIHGWAMFDWANSSYALVISTAVFPAYFSSVVDDNVSIFGMQISDSALYAYSTMFAYIVIAFLSPILSGIADYGGKKKAFLRFFTILGSIACLSLLLFKDMSSLWIGMLSFVIATIGFGGGIVFYNSYLPDIASEDKYDSVSAKGFSYGYIGSVLLLIVNLAIIIKHETFGFESAAQATRVAFAMVGLWWFGWGQYAINRLPNPTPKQLAGESLITKGWEEIKNVWAALQTQPNTKRFLLAFFSYNAGVQTVIYMAGIFGEKILHFETTELISVILLIQIVGIIGAYTFSKLSDRVGNRKTIITMLIVWILVCLAASSVETKSNFYIIAVAVGMVMGGIQSLSRATYSKLLPANTKETASYFSFFDVLEKLATVLGTFAFGFIEQLTGSMRGSALALTAFFVIGMVLVWKLEVPSRVEKSVA